MSFLTKTLVILLAFASIFLCSMVVSYVASTRNIQEDNEDLKALVSILKDQSARDKTVHEEKTNEMKALHDTDQITNNELQSDRAIMAADLRSAEREKADYLTKYTNLGASVTGIEASISTLKTELTSSREQLEDQRGTNTGLTKHLTETIAKLEEKTVLLEALDKTARRLVEENVELEAQAFGGAGMGSVVTPAPADAAGAVVTAPTSQTIRGLIAEVSPSLVSISVGLADGVRKGMTFHVTRGSQFLCDIVITNVDTNKAAGVLELVQQQPKVGDHVSTEL